jgi:hypothetical protein
MKAADSAFRSRERGSRNPVTMVTTEKVSMARSGMKSYDCRGFPMNRLPRPSPTRSIR